MGASITNISRLAACAEVTQLHPTIKLWRQRMGQHSLFYTKMIKGVIDAGFIDDGGPECYHQVPKIIPIVSSIIGIIVYLPLAIRYNHLLLGDPPSTKKATKPNILEILVGVLAALSFLLTAYMKVATGKGLFMFNPCHIAVLGVAILSLSPSTVFTRKMHSMWSAWMYGATLALLSPYLLFLTDFEIFLYYLEHFLIVPIGPIVLCRRYGILKPTILNQFVCFSSMALYQIVVLFPLSVATQVNLNFALCHSSGDPFYPIFKQYYFFFAMFYLNLASYLGRWFYYFLAYPFDRLLFKSK